MSSGDRPSGSACRSTPVALPRLFDALSDDAADSEPIDDCLASMGAPFPCSPRAPSDPLVLAQHALNEIPLAHAVFADLKTLGAQLLEEGEEDDAARYERVYALR